MPKLNVIFKDMLDLIKARKFHVFYDDKFLIAKIIQQIILLIYTLDITIALCSYGDCEVIIYEQQVAPRS